LYRFSSFSPMAVSDQVISKSSYIYSLCAVCMNKELVYNPHAYKIEILNVLYEIQGISRNKKTEATPHPPL
jgi:hypothetical protein